MKHILPALCIIAFLTGCAVRKTSSVTSDSGFKSTSSGLEYRFVRNAGEERKAVKGDYVTMHIISKVGDSLIYESNVNNNGPLQLRIPYEEAKNPIIEGVQLMATGDSAIFRISADLLIKLGNPVQPWMKQGTNQVITYYISLLSVKSAMEMLQEEEEQVVIQRKKDEKRIEDYLQQHKIKAQKTESGLYFTIAQPGTGKRPVAGQKVTVNYTGKTLEGTVFDSNVDSAFNHVKPFSFSYAAGQVIAGWDEGIGYLKKGGRATFLIPSQLAYGAQDQGTIKPNSILVFDVELLDIE